MADVDGVAVVEDDVRFDRRDAELLAGVSRHGSVNAAADALERSTARSLNRISTLEEGFGELVERRRGGSGGGGSTLTEEARALLARFDRLAAAVSASARVQETVLTGTVTTVDAELATADTSIGTVRGLRDDATVDDAVQIRIAADALTLHAADGSIAQDETSARNRRRGTVAAIHRGETVHTLDVHVEDVPFHAMITDDSRERLGLAPGEPVIVTWKATATRLVASRTDAPVSDATGT